MSNIRNFCIIAHIDHGKSTLADRMLEMTNTIEKRKMKDQILDRMDLERERGITIKLQPVSMVYKPSSTVGLFRDGSVNNEQLNRGLTQTTTQTNADHDSNDFLYSDITYKIRGAAFKVKKEIGLGHKESVYHHAMIKELQKQGLQVESEKNIDVMYDNESIGHYKPDIVIDDKVIVELKALPEIAKPQQEQLWSYIKGSNYKLALLVNFGNKDVEFKRIVYDKARTVKNGRRESASSQSKSAGKSNQVEQFLLNLIDTPGHVDFSYEVSRSLAAVETAVLLVDATQGIQAQTLANLYLAMEQDLTIIPVANKIDLPAARKEETKKEIMNLLGCSEGEIIYASGKTGEGVADLLDAIIARTPEPYKNKAFFPDKVEEAGLGDKPLRALIFDSNYDEYKGVVAYVRIVEGEVTKGDKVHLKATKAESEALDVGKFSPDYRSTGALAAGDIGYIVTGFKDVSECRVGDTITTAKSKDDIKSLKGYKEPKPMVFAGIFPREGNDLERLREAIEKLKLNDSALMYEPEHSHALGFGFRCGFLGILHLEIFRERLRREYNLDLVVTVPSVAYHIYKSNGEEFTIRTPQQLPPREELEKIEEPWVTLDIITPKDYLGGIMNLAQEKRGVYKNTEFMDEDRAILHYEIPLSSILTDFYDKIKSVSSGFASINYEFLGYYEAKVVKLDIYVAEEPVEALASIVYEDEAYRRGREIAETLKETLPKQMFVLKIQAAIGGKVIASERLSAMRKDVTAKLYGGDVSRKRKLLEKQKKGKKKMEASGRGKVDIPDEAFVRILKK